MFSSSDSESELHPVDVFETRDPFHYEDPLVLSPILQAVLKNDVAQVEYVLLQRGQSVNINDNLGNTPLHVAVLKDKVEVFDYLLSVDGIRIDAINWEGQTPLYLSLETDNKKYFIQKLIEKGADINKATNIGETPLHRAVLRRNNVLEFLIENRANLDSQDVFARTPLMVAVINEQYEAAYTLLAYGADVSVTSNGGVDHNDATVTAFELSLNLPESNFHEIFFHYVFDKLDSSCDLALLTSCIRMKPRLFGKIIRTVSRITYEQHDLLEFGRELVHVTFVDLQLFLKKFADLVEDLFTCFSLLRYVLDFDRNKENFSEYLYLLFSSQYCSDIVQNLPVDESILSRIIKNLFICNVASLDTLKLCLFLASCGVSVTLYDMDCIFKYYGYSEFYKTFLYIVNDTLMGRTFSQMCVFTILSCRIDVDMRFLAGFAYINYCLGQLLSYFAGTEIKKYCLIHYRHKRRARKKIQKISNVPSLLELCRNFLRSFIIRQFSIKNVLQYYTIIDRLPICNIEKDVLTFRKPLYAKISTN